MASRRLIQSGVRRHNRQPGRCWYFRPALETLEKRHLLAVALVSVTPPPVPDPPEAGSDYSTNPAINADGRFVAFQSHADNLVSGVADTNGVKDVFVRDLLLGTTSLISVNAIGTDSGDCAAGAPCLDTTLSGSFNPAISDDGRYVAFVSFAVDLVKGVDIDDVPNIYVRDRDADEDGIFDESGIGESSTTLLSLATDGTAAGMVGAGASTRPVISGDGEFVVFSSGAADILVDAPLIVDTNGSGVDVFRASVAGGAVTRINVDGSGAGTGFTGGTVADFSISSGGTVAFAAGNPGLVSAATGSVDDTNGGGLGALTDIFIGGGNLPVELVSVNSAGTDTGNGASRESAISRNGRHVAFFSAATNLVSGATDDNGSEDLFVRDLTRGPSGRTTLVTRSREVAGMVAGDGPTPPAGIFASEVTAGPAISETGRFIAFRSSAEDLLDPTLEVIDDNELTDIFVYDRDTDEDGLFDEPDSTEMILVSVNAEGTASADHSDTGLDIAGSTAPSISRDGRYVAFASTGRDLIPGGTPLPGGHVYVRDLLTETTILISDTTSGTGVGPALVPGTRFLAQSGDGVRVAFQSDVDASELDSSVVDPPGGSPDFGGIDVFAGTPNGDIRLGRNFATGTTEFTQSFRIAFDDVDPFGVGYYISSDEEFDAGDGLLGTAAVTDPDDLAVDGNRFVSAMIGAGDDELALPGIGSDDPLEDYFILAVGDDLDELSEFDGDPFNEDNTRALRGLYHVAGAAPEPIFAHGAARDDIFTAEVVGDMLEFSYGRTGFAIPGTFRYDLADVSAVHVRTHAGADSVEGSSLPELVFGGAGGDAISGNGGDDRLFGGPGDDRLLGGDGADELDGGLGDDSILAGAGDDTVFDGAGDDTVDVGDDDDTLFSTPGGADVFRDTGGIDTLDFSLATLPITIDLDSSAVQTVDSDGNTIRLIGDWENIVGTDLDDDATFHVRPRTFARRVDGGQGIDRLVVDALGHTVINDGTKLSFPGSGLGDIAYTSIEQLTVINALPATIIIDNGDAGYASVGFQTTDPAFAQGFGGDVQFADPFDAMESTASYTFTDLPPGRYAVSATWTFAPDRATNTPFRIFSDQTLLHEVRINQELPPSEFTDQGAAWQNIAFVDIAGNSLTVEISDDADQFVIADAIRIEPLSYDSPVDVQHFFVDDTMDEMFTVHSGADASLVTALNSFAGAIGGVDNGDTPGSQGGGRRSINWEVGIDDAIAADPLPADFYLSRGIRIETPGQFRVSNSGQSGTSIHFGELNSSYSSTFLALSQPRLASPIGSNLTDLSFFIPGTLTPAGVRGFGAIFTDVDTPTGASIEYFDLNGETILTQFVEPTPGDAHPSFLGVTFDDPVIAGVRITSGAAPLQLIGSPDDITQGGDDDLVVLDNFLFGEPLPPVLPQGEPGTDTFTADCNQSLDTGFFGDSRLCQVDRTATWSFSSIPPGVYQVSATWTPGQTQSSDARYTINNAGESTEVSVNQQLAPTGATLGNVPWQPLTKIRVAGGLAPIVTLSSSNGPVIADAIELRPASDLQLFDFQGASIPKSGAFDFGQVPMNQQGQASRTRQFTISNDFFSAPLLLSNLHITGSGFSVSEFGATRLPPGASTTFDVIFSADTVAQFGGQVMFNSNDLDHALFAFNLTTEVVTDTTPPVVQILQPDDGALFIEGTQVELAGLAPDCVLLDEPCAVTIGGQTALVRPDGSFVITGIPDSDGELRVQVTDPAGNVGEALRTVTLIPDQPPTIQIQRPFDGQGVVEGSTIPVVVDVDDDVQVVSVELLVDGAVIKTSTLEPFLFPIVVPTTAGDHTIEACATDSGGNTVCDEIGITVFSAPIIDTRSIVVAPDAGHAPEVKVFAADGTLTYSMFAYDPIFRSGVRVATGDINGDGIADIITGAGPGGGPHVKVFDGITGQQIRSFFAFDNNFTGGVYVASGDVSGDGFGDIIIGAGAGSLGGPQVRVFSGNSAALFAQFFAYDPDFTGGVRVATGDINGDGQADIITGAGPGGGPLVKIFDGHLASTFPSDRLLGSDEGIDAFFAFQPSFSGGVFVAGGSVIAGADQNGSDPGGHVREIDPELLSPFDPVQQALQADFFAYDPQFNGGVRVAAGDVNGDGLNDIITGAGPGGSESEIRVFDQAGQQLHGFTPFPGFSGGVFVSGVSLAEVDVVDLTDNGGEVTVDIEGDELVIRDQDGNELFRSPLDPSRTIRLRGSAAADDVLVMRTLGQSAPQLIYDGGLGGHDAVRVERTPTGGNLPMDYLKYTFNSPLLTSFSTDPDEPNVPEFRAVDLEPIEDNLNVVDREFTFAASDDIVIFDTGADPADSILRIDSGNSEVVDFVQQTGTIAVNLGGGADEFRFDLAIDQLPLLDGQGGIDTLMLVGSGNHLDLTDPTQNKPLNIEKIDIIGASPNALTLSGQSVLDATDANNLLVVEHDDDDIVHYAGDGWQVQPPTFTGGRQHHVLTNGAATVHTSNLQFWQNPLAPTDVNLNGETTSLDALHIINFLRRFDAVPVDLADPTSASELPEEYYDVNGSRTASALDALIVINFVADQEFNGPMAPPAGEAVPTALPQTTLPATVLTTRDLYDAELRLLDAQPARKVMGSTAAPRSNDQLTGAPAELDSPGDRKPTELDEALLALLDDVAGQET